MKKLCWKCLDLPEPIVPEITLPISSNRKEKIVNAMIDHLKRDKQGIDTSPGSFLRSLLESVAEAMEQQYLQLEKLMVPVMPTIPSFEWITPEPVYIGDKISNYPIYPITISGTSVQDPVFALNGTTYTTDGNFYFNLTAPAKK